MQNKLFQLPIYRKMMLEHLQDMIHTLLDNNIEFRILCQKQNILFEPELPNRITDTMGNMVLFDISNYSFESAVLTKNELSFGAGFGSENIGATVILPLLSITQIYINEIPIMLNFAPQEKQEVNEAEVNEQDTDKSMSSLLNNPNNQHLLKKRKR